MSTKIYDGMIARTGKMSDLFKSLDSIAIKVKSIASYESAKLMAEEFTRYYDSNITMDKIVDNLWKEVIHPNDEKEIKEYKKNNTNTLVETMRYLINRRNINNRKSQIRDVGYDFNLTLSIFSYKNKLLIIPYSERSEYTKILYGYFDEFEYYNNSDQPEGISDREWDRRRRMWDYALDQSRLAYEVYGAYEQVIQYGVDVYNDMLENIPSKEERASKLAKHELLNKIMLERNNNNETIKASDSVAIYLSSKEEMLSDARKSEMDELTKKHFDSLKNITMDVLKTYVPPKAIVEEEKIE